MSYIDIAIIVLVALFALIGIIKGAFKTIVSFFGWIASFLIAFFLTKVVANALIDISAIGKLVVGESGSLFSWVSSWIPAGAGEDFIGKIMAPLFGQVGDSITAGGLGALTQSQGVALLVAYGFFSAIVCVALFIIIRNLMMIVTMAVKSFSKGKKPNALSRLLGFLLGAVRGAAMAAVGLIICHYVIAVPVLNVVGEQIDSSVLAKPIYTQVSKMADSFFVSNDDETLQKLAKLAGFSGDAIIEESTGENEANNNYEVLDSINYTNVNAYIAKA